MTKWTVTSTQMPTNFNRSESLVIEAETPEDAAKIAADHYRDLGRDLYRSSNSGEVYWSGRERVYNVRAYAAPPLGRVVGVVA
jgi:hypothetical protein